MPCRAYASLFDPSFLWHPLTIQDPEPKTVIFGVPPTSVFLHHTSNYVCQASIAAFRTPPDPDFHNIF